MREVGGAHSWVSDRTETTDEVPGRAGGAPDGSRKTPGAEGSQSSLMARNLLTAAADNSRQTDAMTQPIRPEDVLPDGAERCQLRRCHGAQGHRRCLRGQCQAARRPAHRIAGA